MPEPETFQPPDVAAANARHDAEHGDYRDFNETRVRSAWDESRIMRRKALTDRKIKQYEAQGYYSPAFRDARRELQDRKAARREARAMRDGNFDIIQGRMVYRPG